ncbi:MAG: sensor domain-containing diguanylate cyclase [Oleibacter sp.]|nr:sensor domain-containing diguanylate cyclase [Thalassolituus sp.]
MELKELLENARRNESLLKRLQTFELQLLAAQSWQDYLTLILEALPSQFDLDAVSVKINDPDGHIKASMMQSLDLDQGVLLNQIEFKATMPIIKAGATEPEPPWASGLELPLLRGGEYWGQICLYSRIEDRFHDGLATDFMQHLAAVIAACLVMVYQSEKQALMALTDPLTGVENRRGFERAYHREWSRGQRQHHVFAMILLDLDHFKRINDQHGHGTGDRVLRVMCETLRKILRPTDHIGRLGGEEFALLLTGCEPQQVNYVAKRVREGIKNMLVYNDQDRRVPITVSGSYMPIIPRPNQLLSLSQVMTHLDRVLYKAKAGGRDQILSTTSTHSETAIADN